MSDINLLPKSNVSSLKQEHAVAFLRQFSIITLAATAFISVAIFILIFSSPLTRSQEEEKALIGQLSTSSNRIARHVIIQERLNSIAQILKTRNAYEEDMRVLLSVLPDSIEITKMNIFTDTMQITANTTSIDASNTFLNKLIELQKNKEKIKDVSLETFSLQGATGEYFFTVKITLL